MLIRRLGAGRERGGSRTRRSAFPGEVAAPDGCGPELGPSRLYSPLTQRVHSGSGHGTLMRDCDGNEHPPRPPGGSGSTPALPTRRPQSQAVCSIFWSVPRSAARRAAGRKWASRPSAASATRSQSARALAYSGASLRAALSGGRAGRGVDGASPTPRPASARTRPPALPGGPTAQLSLGPARHSLAASAAEAPPASPLSPSRLTSREPRPGSHLCCAERA